MVLVETLRRTRLLATAVILASCSTVIPTPTTQSPPTEAAPVDSCGTSDWPTMVVTCAEAQRSVSLPGIGPGSPSQIWLTTLEAVDAAFSPPPQTGDHPADPTTAVWVFVNGSISADPWLHVSDATNPLTRDGAFVYLYRWSELARPELPSVMPTVASPTR